MRKAGKLDPYTITKDQVIKLLNVGIDWSYQDCRQVASDLYDEIIFPLQKIILGADLPSSKPERLDTNT